VLRRKRATECRSPLVAGNRDLALLRAACNWAVLGGLLPWSPFRVGDVPAVKLAHEEPRIRRLPLGEAERLMQAARGLHDLILAALETGCRSGELLSMQWHQIRFSPRAEVFPAGTENQGETR
jgi:integrase